MAVYVYACTHTYTSHVLQFTKAFLAIGLFEPYNSLRQTEQRCVSSFLNEETGAQ